MELEGIRKEITARVEDFFKRRNSIAHAIKTGTSSGPTQIEQDITIFRAFGFGITAATKSSVSRLHSPKTTTRR